MGFDLPFDASVTSEGHVEIFKSWSSFSTYFENAQDLRVVTFCDSPKFIVQLFDDIPTLDRLEVVVGDVDDYRERLIDKPDLADRLERLKREGRLVIYLTDTKEVHSKLYLIEYEPNTLADESGPEGDSEDDSQLTLGVGDNGQEAQDDTSTDDEQEEANKPLPGVVILGSPNLSKNAWSNQTNAGLVIETTTDSEVWHQFESMYEEHRSYNNDGPFLDDLTERLEATDEDREEVVTLFTEGKVGTQDELGEVHGRLADHIEDEIEAVDLVVGDDVSVSGEAAEAVSDGVDEGHIEADGDSAPASGTPAPSDDVSDATTEERINLSLRGYDETTKETLQQMTDYDATVSGDNLTTTPRAYQKYTRDVFHVPPMYVSDDGSELSFHADGTVYDLATAPPDDPTRIDAALRGVEDYFSTVDDYGNTLDPTAVKAHMYEALLWFFWAPFVNRDAAFYNSHGIDLDKALRNLYIYGESNAGKGTFIRFALSLISANRVESPVDADEITKKRIRSMRSANTAFPIVVDDITKKKVNRLDTFRNYWGEWTGETNFPLFGFVSNDKRPDEWFRNRAKILHFDVNFTTSMKGEAEVKRLIEADNELFQWFAHEYLRADLTLADDVDTLAPTRRVFESLYERANRDIPDYFPSQPAEQEYDRGRERWRELLAREDIEVSNEGDRVVLSFPESMSTEIYTYKRDPPTEVRVEKRGRDLVIKTPAAFDDWVGSDWKSESSAGVVERARGWLSR